MNLVEVTAQAGQLRFGSMALAAPRALPEGALRLGIRPEYLELLPEGTPGTLPGRVTRVQDIGTYLLVTVDAAGQPVKARLAPDASVPTVGDAVGLQVLGEHTCYYRNEELVE